MQKSRVMLRRQFILAAPIAAASFAMPSAALAAEAAAPLAGDGVSASLTESDRAAIEQRLRSQNYVLTGDIRRKGALIVALGVQQGVPWRLVIDGRSGEIIGRRPLAETASWPR
ncbi:MAG: hypothetical protein ACRCTI_07865 [Beijerinckiaceae bacterium]